MPLHRGAGELGLKLPRQSLRSCTGPPGTCLAGRSIRPLSSLLSGACRCSWRAPGRLGTGPGLLGGLRSMCCPAGAVGRGCIPSIFLPPTFGTCLETPNPLPVTPMNAWAWADPSSLLWGMWAEGWGSAPHLWIACSLLTAEQTINSHLASVAPSSSSPECSGQRGRAPLDPPGPDATHREYGLGA